MKLLLVTYGLNTVGGVQHWQHLFSHKMCELGHEVTILEMYDYSQSHVGKRLERNWSPKIRVIKNNGPIVQRGVNKRTYFSAIKVVLNIFRKFKLNRFLKSEKFESILFTDPNFTFFFFKKTIKSNNCFVQFHSSFDRFKSTSRLRYFLTKRRHTSYKKFIFLSKGDYHDAIANGFDPRIVDYIYNFIDEAKFKNTITQNVIRKNQILFAGNLDNSDKQVDHLFKAIGMLDKKDLGDWKISILGDGSSKTWLKSLAKNLQIDDRIEFVGQIANPSKYFWESSLYVISSSFEGGPLTLLECIYANLPVISYRCSPFIEEVIIDKVTGVLVEKNNIGHLSAAIKECVTNPDLINYMSNNINHIKNKYSSNEILSQWESKLQKR